MPLRRQLLEAVVLLPARQDSGQGRPPPRPGGLVAEGPRRARLWARGPGALAGADRRGPRR
eukprot:3670918-Lingulodinium_polyedra.AAC.1